MGLAVLIAAVVGVPMLSALFQSRDAEQRSKFELLAVLAARDEMYQARLLVASGAAPGTVAHAPAPLTGNPLERVRLLFKGTMPDVVYHPAQERVVTEVKVSGPVNGASPRLHLAEVTARWRETSAAAREGRKTSVVLPFAVLVPP